MPDLVSGPVTVRAPATSANLGPGFDSLGLCLDLADVVTVQTAPAGTAVHVVGEGADTLPDDDAHLVVASIRTAFDIWGTLQPGLRVHCVNAIPQGRGLGSSAAAVVAGLRLAEALSGGAAAGDRDLLALAAGLDGHADNVAACLLGGLVVAWTSGGAPAAVRLNVDDRVFPVVCCADRPMPTPAARALLPKTVAHAAAADNSARAALLSVALTSRPDLLLPATVDHLHQEARRAAIPQTMRLVDRLRARGVAAVVSGAGPSVLALCTGDQAGAVEAELPVGWRLLRLGVDPRGARREPGRPRE